MLKHFSNIKGDITGGITTSVIALPLAIAFGVVAFAPLGDEYIAQGALTGLYGVIVAGILTSLFGGTPGQIAVPTAPMSVMVTSIIATLLKDPEIAALGDNQVTIILVLAWATLASVGAPSSVALATAVVATATTALGVGLSGRRSHRAREAGWLLQAVGLATMAAAWLASMA